jgi:predicted acylesterase/phospholipase RssA
MDTTKRTILLSLALLTPALAGCALQLPQIDRPPLASQAVIPAHPIVVNANQLFETHDAATTASQPATKSPSIYARSRRLLDADQDDSAHGAKCAALAQANRGLISPVASRKDAIAVLSGGGAHGTFGAGFLLGLQDVGALPDDAQIVTGISTGSLQATFVFLARQPVPPDRSYAWLNRTALAAQSLPGATGSPPPRPGHSSLEDLALAYAIHDEGEIAKLAVPGSAGLLTKGLTLIERGSLADLAPLRTRLRDLISRDTIAQVALQACNHRALLIGAADYDDGNGYALDLTRLAMSAFDQDGHDIGMDAVRDAYVSAMIASSSVPVQVPPVQLRFAVIGDDSRVMYQHMFIDGGAKVGVFVPDRSDARAVTLLVNTSLAITPADPANPAVATAKWDVASFLDRIVEQILETQIYQLSVGLVQDRVDLAKGQLHMAYLSNANDNTPTGKLGPAPENHMYGPRTCTAWQAVDQDQPNPPQQYFPDNMACLIDYGRSRGQQGQWNLVLPPPVSAATVP